MTQHLQLSDIFICIITNILFLLDGQPPKFNLKNHIATNDSSSVQSHSAAESKSPSPPVRKSSTVLSEPNIVKNPEVVSNMNENMSPKHTDQTSVLYCEDYAEIVENEEGDYSRWAIIIIILFDYIIMKHIGKAFVIHNIFYKF